MAWWRSNSFNIKVLPQTLNISQHPSQNSTSLNILPTTLHISQHPSKTLNISERASNNSQHPSNNSEHLSTSFQRLSTSLNILPKTRNISQHPSNKSQHFSTSFWKSDILLFRNFWILLKVLRVVELLLRAVESLFSRVAEVCRVLPEICVYCKIVLRVVESCEVLFWILDMSECCCNRFSSSGESCRELSWKLLCCLILGTLWGCDESALYRIQPHFVFSISESIVIL